jgi:hypothetical protein
VILALLALLAACAPPASPPVAEAPPDLLPLDDARLIRRMSLDLRGTLPSLAELDSVVEGATPATLRDTFLDDPRFEERLVQLLGQAWRTQVDEFLVLYTENPELAGDPTSEYPFERAVGEEPLRLMAHVAAEGLPWSTIVTADWSMANEVTGRLWPNDYPADGLGWQVVRYTDQRPAAGVLATNGLWWRYFSTVSNYNRGRTAAIARLLLCEDYTARPVTLSASTAVTDAETAEDELRENPYCLGCHASLDPAATALFGFWPANEYNLDELERYHPERELVGEDLLGVESSWFGTPFSGLSELGVLVAADPRFARCTVETAASLLWRRPVGVEDAAEIEAVRARHVENGTYKDTLAALTDGARYRVGAYADTATDATRAREVSVRMMDAPLLASVLRDLTGFSWSYGGFAQLENDTWGYRLLGGGVDGEYATRSQATPGLTWLAVWSRAAEAAAAYAVDTELVDGGARLTFGAVTLDDDVDSAAFDAEITALSRRLYAEAPDAEALADVRAMWAAIAADAGAAEAWRGTLAALLQDPRFVTY